MRSLAFSLLVLLPGVAATQGPQLLDPLEVSITREASRAVLDLPFAISIIKPDSMRPGQRRLSLDETLFGVPGVTVANRQNPTQDPRISIRGFGARSAFGVRGIRILRDGIPLTLPDGQTPVDYLDLESVGTVEVIRGSAAALYGNAAGGVIDIRTARAPDQPFAGRMRFLAGSHGLARAHAMAGGSSETAALGWQAHATHTRSDGYRDHSALRSTSAHAHALTRIGEANHLNVHLMLFDMPRAENPGALTLAEMQDDRTMAQALTVERRAGKVVRQGQLGVSLERSSGEGDREFTVALYGGRRTLDNPLPFAIIDIDRSTFGASLRTSTRLRVMSVRHRVTAGIDAQWQNDDRQNFENCNRSETPPPGAPPCFGQASGRGPLRLDQRERVSSVGPFLRTEIELTARLLGTLGVRADRVSFDVRDRLITDTDPDDSGSRILAAVSPIAGLVLRLGDHVALYGNVSSAFETPTATELANQPDGSAGLNRDLDPQRAVTWEIGLKGVALTRVRYDVAVYTAAVRDELIPFEIPGGGGRRYFRNAGRTQRRGAEGGIGVSAGEFTTHVSYAWSHFRFLDFTVGEQTFAGSRIPGIPRQQLQGSVTWNSRALYATVEGMTASSVFGDDANSVRVPGFEILNLRVGAQGRGGAWLAPVAGIQNLFDRRYVSSVVVNAAGGRFYEPAPRRTLYVGLAAGN